MVSRISDSAHTKAGFFPALSPAVPEHRPKRGQHGSPIFASLFCHGRRHKNLPPGKKKMLFADPVWANTGCVLTDPFVPEVHRWTQDLVFDSDLTTMCS